MTEKPNDPNVDECKGEHSLYHHFCIVTSLTILICGVILKSKTIIVLGISSTAYHFSRVLNPSRTRDAMKELPFALDILSILAASYVIMRYNSPFRLTVGEVATLVSISAVIWTCFATKLYCTANYLHVVLHLLVVARLMVEVRKRGICCPSS